MNAKFCVEQSIALLIQLFVSIVHEALLYVAFGALNITFQQKKKMKNIRFIMRHI